MNIDFKFEVGSNVKVPLLDGVVKAKILSRSFYDNGHIRVIEYETNAITGGISYTQEELERHNYMG